MKDFDIDLIIWYFIGFMSGILLEGKVVDKCLYPTRKNKIEVKTEAIIFYYLVFISCRFNVDFRMFIK